MLEILSINQQAHIFSVINMFEICITIIHSMGNENE